MSSRIKFTLIGVVALLVAAGVFIYINRPTGNILEKFNKKSTDELSSKPQPESPFGELITPIEGDNVDKLLEARMKELECKFPDNPAKFVTTSGMVPGIKEDATSLDDYWILNALQPVILSYETFNDTNYFIGALRDDAGVCKKIAFVLTGNFNVEDSSGMFDQSKITILGSDNFSYVTFDEFTQKYPTGTQITVYYLGHRPEPDLLVPELCNVKPPVSQLYCSIQRASEIFSKKAMDRKLLSEVFSFPSELDQIYVVDVAEIVTQTSEEPTQ